MSSSQLGSAGPSSARGDDRQEIMLGRALAACVHPFAAWRLYSTSWRLWILTAYAAAGYVIGLGVLFVLGSA
jgi:hypothetical protein